MYQHQTWKTCSSWQNAVVRQGSITLKAMFLEFCLFLTKILRRRNDGPLQTSVIGNTCGALVLIQWQACIQHNLHHDVHACKTK